MLASFCIWFALQRAEVVVLIEQLGDEQYRVRVEAQAQLEQLVTAEWGYLYLSQLEGSRNHADPEVSRRVHVAIEAYYTVSPSVYSAIPWLDMLPSDYPNRQALLDHYLKCARHQFGYGHNQDWPDYRNATWLYVKDRLRSGTQRTQVIQLLDEMAMREVLWRNRQAAPSRNQPSH